MAKNVFIAGPYRASGLLPSRRIAARKFRRGAVGLAQA
jgi:hypothetical protein